MNEILFLVDLLGLTSHDLLVEIPELFELSDKLLDFKVSFLAAIIDLD